MNFKFHCIVVAAGEFVDSGGHESVGGHVVTCCIFSFLNFFCAARLVDFWGHTLHIRVYK